MWPGPSPAPSCPKKSTASIGCTGLALPRRPEKFDSRVVEPGPPPILAPGGIVLIYNGADDKLVYRTGVAVFDRKDPRKLLSRSDAPIFAPEKEWEIGRASC